MKNSATLSPLHYSGFKKKQHNLNSETFIGGAADDWPTSSPVFAALHGMQTRSSDENSVRLSVRLSHACIVTKLRSVQIYIPYERTFILVF